MTRVTCSAITCVHNAGCKGGEGIKHGDMGMFECLAPEITFDECEEKCEDCGLRADLMDCKSYKRWKEVQSLC